MEFTDHKQPIDLPPHLSHGSEKAWLFGCRCRPCDNARCNARRQRSKLRKINGTHVPRNETFIPLDTARKHLIQLLDRHPGTGLVDVARILKVPKSSLSTIVHDTKRTRVHRDLHYKIMSVKRLKKVEISGYSYVDSTGTRRRLQALIWCGYSMGHLAREIGVNHSTIVHIVNPKNPCKRVQVRVRDTVTEFYQEAILRDHPVGRYADRARKYAKEKGFFPPGAWGPIDDPNYKPPFRREKR